MGIDQHRPAPFIAAVALACGVLGGCTASELPTDAAPASTPTPTPTPTPIPPCIQGAWRADAAALQPAYDAIPGDLDYPRATIDPEASATIVFLADGTFLFAQDVPATLTWFEEPAAVLLGGSMTGTYSAGERALSLSADENDLAAVPADDRAASALFAAATQETLAEWPVSASAFTCDADTLVLDLQTEGRHASVEFARG